MSIESKQVLLNQFRDEYVALMNKVISMPASLAQKKQAMLRFDEGHMWLQNGIINYVEPKPKEPQKEEVENEN